MLYEIEERIKEEIDKINEKMDADSDSKEALEEVKRKVSEIIGEKAAIQEELRSIGNLWIDELRRLADESEDVFEEYFADKGVRYVISTEAVYEGVIIDLAGGNPTVWIDTDESKLHVNSGMSHEAITLESDVRNALDKHFDNSWDMFCAERI